MDSQKVTGIFVVAVMFARGLIPAANKGPREREIKESDNDEQNDDDDATTSPTAEREEEEGRRNRQRRRQRSRLIIS